MIRLCQEMLMTCASYEKVHSDPVSDEIERVVDKPETFVRVNQYQYQTFPISIERLCGTSS